MNKNEFRQPVNGLHSIKIIQAFERGETIEVRLKGSGDSWEELNGKVFNFGACDYRIKKKKNKPKSKSLSEVDERFCVNMKKSATLIHIQAQFTIIRNILDKRVDNFDVDVMSMIHDIKFRLASDEIVNMRKEYVLFDLGCTNIENTLKEIQSKYRVKPKL